MNTRTFKLLALALIAFSHAASAAAQQVRLNSVAPVTQFDLFPSGK